MYNFFEELMIPVLLLTCLPFRLPFWPYAKGIAILLLVVPYFHGASYVYLHFVKPYIYANSQLCGLLLTPKAKVGLFNEPNDILDAAESCDWEKGEVEFEKEVIYEVNLSAALCSGIMWTSEQHPYG